MNWRRERIGILHVARYLYPTDFSIADRDLALMRSYYKTLGPIWLVVQSPDEYPHVWVEEGIQVHYVPRVGRGLANLLAFWWIALLTGLRLVRKHKMDILEASDLAGAFVLIPLRLIFRARLLLHLQFQFFDMSPAAASWLRRWIFRFGALAACRFADSVRCVSDDVCQQAIQAGVDKRKLVIIPVRCDMQLFDPSRVAARPAGVGRELVFVGTLTHLKGVHVLLTALPKIFAEFPDAQLRIVGDGPYRLRLEQLADRLGVAHRVFFTGAMRHVELPEALGQTDVLVHSALTEAMPRAILEAMAMERPVVATRVGGVPEVLRDGIDGLLVPAGDSNALAEAVCRVLGRPDLAQTMGANGRRRVLEHFSFEQNVRTLVRWHRESIRNDISPI